MKRKKERILAGDIVRAWELLDEYIDFLARAVYQYNTVGGSTNYGAYLSKQLGEIYDEDLGMRFEIKYKHIELEEKRYERERNFIKG